MSAAPASFTPGSRIAVKLTQTRGLDVTTVAMDATRATVQLRGEMDLSNADLLTAVVASQLSLGRRFIRLDLSGLDFCDLAGLRAIVEAHNRCLAARGTLVLTGVTARIARLVTLMHFDEVLLVADGPGDPPRPARRHLAAVPEHAAAP